MSFPEAKNVTDPLDPFKQDGSTGTDDELNVAGDMERFTDWFRDSVSYMSIWREKARESYAFVEGKQWSEGDIKVMRERGEPPVTINKIKPLINMLSGYQRNNRYDIDFLPRTNDDAKLCDVRKAMTKYVMDRSSYDTEESSAFINGCICGFGWFEVGYKQDDDLNGEGEAFVRSESPFNIYIDPEAKKLDYSDCKYIIRARWVNKDELCEIYPEFKDQILAKTYEYDKNEEQDMQNNDRVFYQRDSKKLRLCECWYKQRVHQTTYLLPDGTTIVIPEGENIPLEQLMMLEQTAANKTVDTTSQVRVCVFFDDVKLEDMESPYEHGEFPFVPYPVYHYDETELPLGLVDAAKDVQRDLNKRRTEFLSIINKSSRGGWMYTREGMNVKQAHNFSKNAAKPGSMNEVTDLNQIREITPPNPPMSILQALQEAANDMQEVTGINESMMGVDMPNSASGRAIELRQKQAITHLMPLFDGLRQAKKEIAYRLWGRRGHKGVIPQFYTEEKVYRIEGKNGGYEFLPVNQKQAVMTNDPLMPVITQTLNDLSQGEFDVVIADVSASATMRDAQFWALCDAVSKLGIPGDMVFDMLIDLSNVPNKEDIIQRWQQRQQQQTQAAEAQQQQQLQLVQAQNNRTNKSINIKDVPLPIQLAMCAKEGLVDPALAQHMMEIYVRTMAPQVAAQEAMQNQQAAMQQAQAGTQQQMNAQMQQALLNRMAAQRAIGGNNTRAPANSRMTQAAANSLRAGQPPAVR